MQPVHIRLCIRPCIACPARNGKRTTGRGATGASRTSRNAAVTAVPAGRRTRRPSERGGASGAAGTPRTTVCAARAAVAARDTGLRRGPAGAVGKVQPRNSEVSDLRLELTIDSRLLPDCMRSRSRLLSRSRQRRGLLCWQRPRRGDGYWEATACLDYSITLIANCFQASSSFRVTRRVP